MQAVAPWEAVSPRCLQRVSRAVAQMWCWGYISGLTISGSAMSTQSRSSLTEGILVAKSGSKHETNCQETMPKQFQQRLTEAGSGTVQHSAEWVAGFCPHGTAPWVCPYVPPCAQFGPTLPPIGITLSCWCSKAFQIVAASILILHSTQNFLLNVEDPYWRLSLAKAPLFLTISIDSYKGDGLS